jgi:arabinofuranan 3-O-arabinosyltransferase
VKVSAGGRQVALRPRGSVAELDAGEPLRARSCAGPVRVGRDVQRIRALPGTFSVDLLRLRSPAPAMRAEAVGGGTVVDPGRLGNSTLDGVTVDLEGPSWLMLGQSYSKGWRATCDGRSLGASQPINGYANGWRAPADCRRVAFAFAPQERARLGYAISAVVCLLLLAFLAAGWWADRGRERQTAAPSPLAGAAVTGMALPRAAAIAVALTIPLALLFALRTSLFIFPALTFILWRGVGARVLIASAVALLGIAVPILYAVTSPRNRGGYNFEYSVELIRAHWVGVLAFVLLGAACWRMLAAARSARQPTGRSISATKTARAE